MGLLITVEGGEFTGKSSLITPLSAVLERSGFPTLTSREPGGTPKGEEIRAQIFARLREDASQEELAELFNEARKIHLDEVVKPFLGEHKEKPAVVILDRFIDSTIQYQGREGGVPLHRLRELEQRAIDGYYPDLTILLYFPEDKFHSVFGARRQLASSAEGRSQTAWDEGDISHHLARQRNYFKVPEVYAAWGIPRNFRFIDSTRSPRDVVIDALREINPLLSTLEGNVRSDEEREIALLRELSSYAAEGFMMPMEWRYWDQEALLREEGTPPPMRR